MAGEHGVYVALAQLVGFEGGKAFPGGIDAGRARGETSWPRRRFRGGAHPGDARLRGDHPGPGRSAAAGRSGDAAAASAGVAARRRGGARAGTAGGAGSAGRRRLNEPALERAPRLGEPRSAEHAARRPPALAPAPCAPIPRQDPLAIDPELTRRWLVEFIRDEVQRRRGFERVVIGLSGGVDSSLVAYLAAEALGAGQRDRGPDALPDLEPGEPGPRPAGDRRARHPGTHGGHQRARWTALAAAIGGAVGARPGWATSWRGPG